MKMNKVGHGDSITHIIGIDEAGRGPLAGPVAVGMCIVPVGFDFAQIPNVRDSKKLSERQREECMQCIVCLLNKDVLHYKVSFGSASQIDKRGIEKVTQSAIERLLRLYDPKKCRVLLDGRLKAPAEFIHQKTITKGDDKEPVISLASICAKVLRDRKMVRYAKKYPEYGFEKHKGYGTKHHKSQIVDHGTCEIHRISFIHLTN